MSTLSPAAFHELVEEVRELLDHVEEEYEAAYQVGYGGRRRGLEGGRGSDRPDPTTAAWAAGARARGACRKAARLLRETTQEWDAEDRGTHHGIRAALHVLAEVLGGDEPLSTSTPRAPRSITDEELAASVAAQARRRARGEAPWGAA